MRKKHVRAKYQKVNQNFAIKMLSKSSVQALRSREKENMHLQGRNIVLSAKF